MLPTERNLFKRFRDHFAPKPASKTKLPQVDPTMLETVLEVQKEFLRIPNEEINLNEKLETAGAVSDMVNTLKTRYTHHLTPRRLGRWAAITSLALASGVFGVAFGGYVQAQQSSQREKELTASLNASQNNLRQANERSVLLEERLEMEKSARANAESSASAAKAETAAQKEAREQLEAKNAERQAIFRSKATEEIQNELKTSDSIKSVRSWFLSGVSTDENLIDKPGTKELRLAVSKELTLDQSGVFSILNLVGLEQKTGIFIDARQDSQDSLSPLFRVATQATPRGINDFNYTQFTHKIPPLGNEWKIAITKNDNKTYIKIKRTGTNTESFSAWEQIKLNR